MREENQGYDPYNHVGRLVEHPLIVTKAAWTFDGPVHEEMEFGPEQTAAYIDVTDSDREWHRQ